MKKQISCLAMTVALAGCVSPGKRTAVGAGAGAAVGAGMGAIIGHQSGDKGKGAMIGAAAGALLGGAIGNRLDKQARELAAIAETRHNDEQIVTTLKNSLLFDTGKADLKPASVDNIHQLSDIIKKYPEDRVVVVGYTDSTGDEKKNQALSERRAQAVRLAMIARGIPSSSVEAVGQGESNPVAPNETAEGRAKNRRVELLISVDPKAK